MKTQQISPASAKTRVLVVDDHPNTASMLARAIAQLGPKVTVLSADSGESALKITRDQSVDILITDMMMTGINGLELIEKLQAHPAGGPSFTVLVTAYDIPGLKITAHRLKVNEVVIKPVRPERICQLVATAIAEFGAEPAGVLPEVKPQPKILIADDLPDNVTLLVRYLTNEGYACLQASDGEQALAKIRAEMPDLILLDMNMPVKDGLQTLHEIRTDPAISHLPVIILTAARIEPMDMQMALNIGADDYVTKPFDRRELLARIRTRLRVKESDDLIRRRNKELSLLPEIGRELSAHTDIDELTRLILRRTVQTLGALWGQIVLLDPQGNISQKSYHFAVDENPDAALPDLKALIQRLRETRQGFIISDTQHDLRWPVVGQSSARSVVVTPLFGRTELLGLLILANETPNYFLTEHFLLLQAIAGQAAIAIDNARLFTLLKNQPAAGQPNGLKTLTSLMERAKTTQITQTSDILEMENRKFSTLVNWIDGRYVVTLREVTR
ncbi:response regulator [bacterium]|nr:response regulator [bacterium]NCT20533.1 response regulator [bacterium]